MLILPRTHFEKRLGESEDQTDRGLALVLRLCSQRSLCFGDFDEKIKREEDQKSNLTWIIRDQMASRTFARYRKFSSRGAFTASENGSSVVMRAMQNFSAESLPAHRN